MVEPLRHRQTKEAANGYVQPTATASHLDSTQKHPWCHVSSNVWFARKQTSIDGHQDTIPLIAVIRETSVTEYPVKNFTHSGLMPANFTTLPHFSVSSAMSLPKSGAGHPSALPPDSTVRALILESARAALVSRFSLSMISMGVPLGAPRPNQTLAS